MIRKLRWKFVTVIMLIVTTILAVMFCFFYVSTEQNARTESMALLLRVARDPDWQNRPWEQGDRYQLPTFTLAVDRSGQVWQVWGSVDSEDLEALQEIADQVISGSGETGNLKSMKLWYYRQRLPSGGWLVTCADRTFELKMLDSLRTNMLLVGVATLAVFFVVSLWLSRWMTRPVERAWKQQRQFVADASHELKTPLTVILSNAELLTGREREMEPQLARWVDNIRVESVQMRRLVEELLTLARSDSGGTKREISDVDWSDLVEQGVLTFEPTVFERGLRLESHVHSGSHVRGDEAWLRQVLDILLDNAAKYSLPGGTIMVTLEKEGERSALLRVSNPSDPIPADELDKLFDRFYRQDRARTTGSGGYGLGLSIAKRLVSEMKGRIWAEHRNGVTVMQVRLPAEFRGKGRELSASFQDAGVG